MVGIPDHPATAVAALGQQLEEAEGDLAVSAGDEDFHELAVPAQRGARPPMTTGFELLAAFVLIIGGAIGFTNAVEWLGQRLDLGAGAVGALLAAVGTALPESLIPIVALVSGGGGEESTQIAIGAIVGAPFLLGTLAMLLVVGSAHVFSGRRDQGAEVAGEPESTRRDLRWFLMLMPVAIVIGAIGAPAPVRYAAAALLLVAYGLYVRSTLHSGGGADDDEELAPLYLDTSKADPPNTFQMTTQFVLSLAAIIVGAELFVNAIEHIAEAAGVSALVLALVLAPLATEMPEKANSVLWVRRGKDALALGNITGAMTFQASVPVALGLVFTTWELDAHALTAAIFGLCGGALARWALPRRHVGLVPVAVWGTLFCGFVAYAVATG
jgi:cation:H+ antiporter